MNPNQMESSDVATVTDEITHVGDQSIPLGVGNFEDVTHDPLAGAESKRRFDTGSLLIFGVVIISIGGLVAMRALAGDEEIAVGNEKVDQTISRWLEDQRGSHKTGGVVTLFPEEYLDHQVPLADVQKNPFVLFEAEEYVPEEPVEDPEDPEIILQRKRDARLKIMEQAATRIRLQSVLMASSPLANVNDTIVRIGESLVISPEDISFRVTDIRSDGITMVTEEPMLNIVYETVINVHKD